MEIRIDLSRYSPDKARDILHALEGLLYDTTPPAAAPAPPPAAPAPAPVPPAAPAPVQAVFPGAEEITIDKVRTAMREYIKANGKAAGQALIFGHGIRKLTDADPETLAAIYDEVAAGGEQ